MESETLQLPQDGEPCLLQRRVVIGIDAVDADNGSAVLKEPAREAEADKACGAGDQNRILRHLILS